MASKTLLTVEQFDQLPAEDALRYELDKGELVEVSGPSYQHNYIRDTIIWLLRSFLNGKQLGEVIAEQEFRMDQDTVRRPDVAFIRSEAASRIDRSKSILDVIPLLVVEIVSPNDAAEYVMRKVDQYLARGVQAVWITTRCGSPAKPGTSNRLVSCLDFHYPSASFLNNELLRLRTDFAQDTIFEPVLIPPLNRIHLHSVHLHAEMQMIAARQTG